MRSKQEQGYAAYYDPELYEQENDVLFARTWVNTGSASRMASPGDAIPVTVAGLPLILLRDEEGCIRGFHNVCRHRGARVLRTPCQGRKLLHCAYHGWAYGMDGALRGTPHWKISDRSAPADFDPAHYGLEPVRVAVWLDQVFVNIDGKAPKFEQFVAPVTSRWENYDLSRLSLGEQRTLKVDANWKFAIENYLDTYHLPMIHPQLGNAAAARRFTDVNIDDTVFGICYTTGATDKPKSSGHQLTQFSRLSDAQRASQDILALYPNTLIELQPRHMMLVAIEPDGPARCTEYLNFYFIDEDATDPKLADERRRTAEAWCEIMNQDIEVLEDLQAAAHSPTASRAADMSPVWEQGTVAFRSRVARALLDQE